MWWAFRPRRRAAELPFRFSRPAVETLEDRLAPGGSLSGVASSEIVVSRPPTPTPPPSAVVERLGPADGPGTGNLPSRTDHFPLTVTGDVRALAAAGEASAPLPAATVSVMSGANPLVTDLVFHRFGELFPREAPPRHPLSLPGNPALANTAVYAFDPAMGLPTSNRPLNSPLVAGDATGARAVPAPTQPVAAPRVPTVTAPTAGTVRAATIAPPLEPATVPRLTGTTAPLHRQERSPTAQSNKAGAILYSASVMVFHADACGLANDGMASPAFEMMVPSGNATTGLPNGTVLSTAAPPTGSPSFETVVLASGAPGAGTVVHVNLATPNNAVPAGAVVPSSGVVTLPVTSRPGDGVPNGSGQGIISNDLAPPVRPNGAMGYESAPLAPSWTVTPSTLAVANGNGKAAPARAQGGQAMSLAQRKALALGLRYLNPEWTDETIAQAAGVSRRTLFRWAEYNALKKAQRSVFSLPRGYKTAEGDIEAWTEEE